MKNFKFPILLVFALLVLTSCSKVDWWYHNYKDNNPKSEKEITSFRVVDKGGDTLNLTISDTLIEGVTGDTLSRDSLIVIFTYKGKEVRLDNTTVTSGTKISFNSILKWTVVAEDGTSREYKVKLHLLNGIPIVYVTSPPIVSKEDYVRGSIRIEGNFLYQSIEKTMRIRGRGNSTWGQPKNPYRLNLDTKFEVLGMPEARNWALLANYFDKSLLRNDSYFELSERMGLAWTPRRRLTDVYLNGTYVGNYLLTEIVEPGVSRVNIKLMDDKNPADLDGDYLLEVNSLQDEERNFRTNTLVPISLKEPENVTDVQWESIKADFLSLESAIYSRNWNKVHEMIDIDSWIKWSIVNEVFRNRDAIMYGSCFIYKKEGKLYMGPVWDADLSSGSYVTNYYNGWYVNTANLLNGLINVSESGRYTHDPVYTARYKEIWNQYLPVIESMPQYIDRTAKYNEKSASLNWSIWPFEQRIFGEQYFESTPSKETEYLARFIKVRVEWLKGETPKL